MIGSIQVAIQSDISPSILKVPVFDAREVPRGYCARYARLAAEGIFGKVYPKDNAWDYRYSARIIKELDGQDANEELNRLAYEGELQPGMIIGVFYPPSSWNNKLDMKGQYIEFSHLMLFLGISKGEPVFADHFISGTRIRKLSQFADDGLTAKIVFDSFN